MSRRRMHDHLKFVVSVGGSLKTLPRVRCERVYRNDKRAHRLQRIPLLHATRYSQVVAASGLDPDRGEIKFWAGHIEHWQRVGFPERTHHYRIPIAALQTQVCHDYNLSQSCFAASSAFVALSHDGTRA